MIPSILAATALQAPLAAPPFSLRGCICACVNPRSEPMRLHDSAAMLSIWPDTDARSFEA
jgi:hypothetical protein